MMADDRIRLSTKQLLSIGKALFRAYAVPEEHAQATVEAMLRANLRGVDSHGFLYLPIYLKRIQEKVIRKDAVPELIQQDQATAVVDGHDGLGAVNGTFAAQISRQMMHGYGVGFTAVRRSGHFGMAAHYASLAAGEQAIGMAMTNAPPSVAAFGAMEPVLGTNPMAFVFPLSGRAPLVIDFATSAIARTKLRGLADQGGKIPEGLALNKHGYATTDATEAYEGVLLPAAGVKGYALAVLVEILTGVLAQAAVTTSVGQLVNEFSRTQNVGHFVGAISIEHFLPLDRYEALMSELIDSMKEAQKAPQVEQIYYPGEIEHEVELQRSRKGIPLKKDLIQCLNELLAEHELHEFIIDT